MPAQTAGFTLSIAAERIVGVDEASCLLMPSPTAACNSGYIYRNLPIMIPLENGSFFRAFSNDPEIIITEDSVDAIIGSARLRDFDDPSAVVNLQFDIKL